MEKRKRWQFWIIVGVLALTVYNILPTLFFYSQPLNQPVQEKQAEQVASQITKRVNTLEGKALTWLGAFSKNLSLKPSRIAVDEGDPKLITLEFKKASEAKAFEKFLPTAGAYIPFAPSQLQLAPRLADQPANHVVVQRQVATRLPTEVSFATPSLERPPSQPDTSYFSFSMQKKEDGTTAPLYRELIANRFANVAVGLGGTSEPGRFVQMVAQITSPLTSVDEGQLLSWAEQIVEYDHVLGIDHPITRRFYASFTQIGDREESPAALVQSFLTRLEKGIEHLEGEMNALRNKANEEEEALLSIAQNQKHETFQRQQSTLQEAASLVRQHADLFAEGKPPWTEGEVLSLLAQMNDIKSVETLSLDGRNPLIESLSIDWTNSQIAIDPYPEVKKILAFDDDDERLAYEGEKLNQFLIHTIASLNRTTGEEVSPKLDHYLIPFDHLPGSESFVTLNLPAVAQQRLDQLFNHLQQGWQPIHPDLQTDRYPILSHATYKTLDRADQAFGLVMYAPVLEDEPYEGFRNSSLYVIARGMSEIAEQALALSTDHESNLQTDFQALYDLMAQNGFLGYAGSSYGLSPEFNGDYIFELPDYYSALLMATREAFSVLGNQRYAILEFSNEKQRLLTENTIDTQIHEDLLKWRDEYQAAQISIDPMMQYVVPPPTRSPLWSNLALSAKKFFRGDDRKILKWGLDLSGGKTVTIGLRDKQGRPVTNPDDLREGANELYTRVNKMGVSEVEIRVEGNHISLSFPGAQGLAAKELIKGSTMTFHIINEKFSPNHSLLANSTNRFLQEVWNEAVVTNQKDLESINMIAYRRLGGSLEGQGPTARSEAAQILVDHGLMLTDPQVSEPSSTFDDTLSSIAVWRGESPADWQQQTHPLVIVFHNYALEGTSLDNVHAEYDPSKGNALVFGIKRSSKSPEGLTFNPRADLYAWTSHYAQSQIAGTPNELFSQGKGWRMATVLNDSIINAASLSDPLRDSAMVTGQFSQREVQALVADLKAGSLSFTPKILSERNVSPDLGRHERTQGILAALIGLALVTMLMSSYYRFAGIIASLAVIFNLLIMWGVLQNLDAALTLPGIAGIILTMGMAVDANVLVFERIREEVMISGRLTTAVQAGYRKAFTAIFDSNLTTIIAALILLNFDAGPIKGFAITLIIGIVSSMFTALFMTRYFFAGWVQNPKHRELRMANLFRQTSFNFINKAKLAMTCSLVVILIGAAFLYSERHTILGMDFTGGYSLNITLEEKLEGQDLRDATLAALIKAGANPQDVQVRTLNHNNHLRIQLGMGMEQPQMPFHALPFESDPSEALYRYQANPRIAWVVDALAAHNLTIEPSSLAQIDGEWSEMSGQFSDVMRNNAILGLALALFAILVYITIRFEFKYAVSATFALGHDLLITIGALAILRALSVPVQIDLQVVGALMTIIGYSLNDTIIVFDRIREDGRILRKLKFHELINHALNATLNRTIMTSSTTLIVLLALVIFGGKSIFDFALVMTMGVVFGTFSSLFIASPILLFFHGKEEARAANGIQA